MELPTISEFQALLQEEKLFRDYFNTFLNLPIFAKRLTFCSDINKFIVEPRVKSSYHLLYDDRVWLWVFTSRLPLFWRSDLYLEYRLSQCLVNSAPSVGGEQCRVSVIDSFRRFLCETEGECLWMFWKDTERLKLTKDKQHLQRVYHHIHTTYLQDNAPFVLPSCVKEKAVLCTKKELSLRHANCRAELLFSAQVLALEELLKYWTLRYNIHQETRLALARESSSNDVISGTFSREANHERVRSAQVALLPCIIYEQGGMAEHEQTRTVPHIKPSNLSLPSLVAREYAQGKEATKDGVDDLITPSTHHLFPQKCEYSTPSSSLLQELPVLPCMSASLRADSLSGHPFLVYLTSQGRQARSHLLFWQSVEFLLAQDEMRRYHKKIPSTRCDQLVFFEIYPMARDLRQLVELFLKSHSCHRVELPRSMRRRELCVLVEKGLGQNLLLTAQEHSTKVLHAHWQAYLLTDHQSFMKSCTSKKVIRHNLQRALRAAKEHSLSSNELIDIVFDPPTLENAWRALRYAETAKYHGIHLLPSRSSLPAIALSPSSEAEELIFDLLDDEAPLPLEGLTLTPMITTICDQLLYDWKQTKIKRSLFCTSTHTYSVTKKPNIPENITEVLRDKSQLEFFRHYLFMQGTNVDTPLKFCMAMEDMKASSGKQKVLNSKLRRIQENFLIRKGENAPLNVHAVFNELSQSNLPSLSQLLAAQEEVVESLTKNWFDNYVEHLKTKEEEKVEKEEEKKVTCKASTKYLWALFAHCVISFRRSLLNPTTAKQFRAFLRDEALKGNSGNNKKVIGTKVIQVTKLLNDLSFWAEVERYKDLVDMIRAGKEKGKHTPEDEIMIHKKAHAIVNCYIDSSVSPRVQVNIPPDLVTKILDNLSQGLITRGLFHEAALNIFSVLVLYWKRFCVHRFAPKERVQSIPDGHAGSVLSASGDQKEHHFFWEGGPILSFSLATGLQWHYPPSYPIREHATNTIKNPLLLSKPSYLLQQEQATSTASTPLLIIA